MRRTLERCEREAGLSAVCAEGIIGSATLAAGASLALSVMGRREMMD